jgi:hypothetical protein
VGVAKKVGFGAVAVAFAAAAVFHAAALVRPAIAPPSPPWRHTLFVAINVAAAFGVVLRPRWFVVPFAVLTVQQLVSHGAAAWKAWVEEGRVDVASLIIVVGMPAVLVALVVDAPSSRRGSGSRGRAPG